MSLATASRRPGPGRPRPGRWSGFRGQLHDGLRRPLPRGGTGPSGGCRRVLDRPLTGHQRPVPEVREGHGPPHQRRAACRSGPLSRCAAGVAGAGLDRLRAATGAGGPGRSLPLVAVHPRCRLASPRGPRQFDQASPQQSRGACGPRGCGGLCRLERQAATDRGRMGAGRVGRARRR